MVGAQHTAGTPVPTRPSGLIALLGTILIVAATACSAVLAVSHIPGFDPPGCGPGGGCEKLKQSAFGVVPETDALFTMGEPPLFDHAGWPTAYLGLAYFAALLAVWLLSLFRGVHPIVYWIARLGALASVGYLIVMAAEGALCPWCLAVHLANFSAVGVLEVNRSRSQRPIVDSSPADEDFVPTTLGLAPTVVTGLVVFAFTTVGLGVAHNAAAVEARDAASDEAIDALLGDADDDSTDTTNSNTAQQSDTNDTSIGDDDGDANATDADANATANGSREPTGFDPARVDLPAAAHGPDRAGADGFTGRYLLGPVDARVRVVMFSNPVCPICRTVERELVQLIERRDDVSLSIKQYPLNGSCNPIGSLRAHHGSCESAYAIETAGELGGPQAFWAVALWLYRTYERGDIEPGGFDRYVTSLGFDQTLFRETMQSDAIKQRVAEDIQQGIDLGVTQTPMVFLNGQPFHGWGVPGSTARAIENAIARAGERLPPRTSSADSPPQRMQLMYQRWLRRPVSRVTLDEDRSIYSPGLAPTDIIAAPQMRVVAFLDYTDQRSRELDTKIRTLLMRGVDVAYQPRVFPMNEACNMFAEVNGTQASCDAAKAVLIAEQLGGFTAFNIVHDALIRADATIDRDVIRGAFQAAGLDVDEAMPLLDDPDTETALLNDAASHANAQPRFGAPAVYLNGRLVQFWEFDDEFILDQYVERARADMLERPELFERR